jgi:hypothetical protein
MRVSDAGVHEKSKVFSAAMLYWSHGCALNWITADFYEQAGQ